MFCDYLNVWQQHEPERGDFLGGRIVSVDGACGLHHHKGVDAETGEIQEGWLLAGAEDVDYAVGKFAEHTGSYETKLFIRMIGGRLEVRGNPSAYGRLDNLFGLGVDDGIETYNQVLRSLGLPEFTEGEETHRHANDRKTGKLVEQVEYSGAHISRADMTQNFAVGMGNVQHFNRWALGQKLYRTAASDESMEKFHRWGWDTVMLSESQYWIKAKSYDKGKALLERTLPEYKKKLKEAAKAGKITATDVHRLYAEAEQYLDDLALWCAEQGIARCEWQFANRWFAQHPECRFWRPGVTESAIREAAETEMGRLTARCVVYQEDAHESLTDREFRLLDAWKKGEAVREKVSQSAFYRFRTSIREKTGYDIAARSLVTQAREVRPVFFQMKPLELVHVPAWYRRPVYPSMALAA